MEPKHTAAHGVGSELIEQLKRQRLNIDWSPTMRLAWIELLAVAVRSKISVCSNRGSASRRDIFVFFFATIWWSSIR